MVITNLMFLQLTLMPSLFFFAHFFLHSPFSLYSRKLIFSNININFNHSFTDNSHQYPFVSFTATIETAIPYIAFKYIVSTSTCIHSFIHYTWLSLG
jgi:hypothetical protein